MKFSFQCRAPIRIVMVALALAMLVPSVSSGNSGGLDSAFGFGGQFASAKSLPPACATVGIGYNRFIPLDDGSFLLYDKGNQCVLRLLRDGEIDPTFVIGTLPNDLELTAVALDAEKRVVTADRAGGDFLLRRYLPSGAPDLSFGTNGKALSPFKAVKPVVTQMTIFDIQFFPDGAMVALGGCGAPYPSRPNAFCAVKIKKDGGIDTRFGSNGVALLPHPPEVIDGNGYIYHGQVQADGKVIALGLCNVAAPPGQTCTVRFTADGQPDPSFGKNGFRALSFRDRRTSRANNIALRSDGSVILYGPSCDVRPGDGCALKLLSNGNFDPSFGIDGQAILEGPVGFSTSGTFDPLNIVVDAQERIYVPGACARSGGRDLCVARYLRDGSLDRSFGVDGAARAKFGGDDYASSVAISPTGQVLVMGRCSVGYVFCAAQFLVDDTGTAPLAQEAEVTEFYAPTLNHYFISANAEEVGALKANAASGWRATGETFGAFPRSGAPATSFPVCRFYGDFTLGPNSHFYTANREECEGLKGLQKPRPYAVPQWNFEEIAFHAGVPVNGACDAATPVAIYRAYNNRATQNDSNHRYAKSRALYDKMLAEGWAGEGIVMCVTR
jgi:uncharacterized delta-60 repeat protein